MKVIKDQRRNKSQDGGDKIQTNFKHDQSKNYKILGVNNLN